MPRLDKRWLLDRANHEEPVDALDDHLKARQRCSIKTSYCYCSYRKEKCCTSPEPKLRYQSTPNFERLITAGRWRELHNLVQIGSMGASPHVGEMYTSTVFFYLFRWSGYIRNGFWCSMAQKTSFSVRMFLLSIRSVNIECKGVKIPKTGPVGKSQPKRKRSKVPYNFVIKMVVIKHK